MHTDLQTLAPVAQHKRTSRTKLVLFLILIFSLACVNTEAAFDIAPIDENTADVTFTYSQEITERYIEAAKRANEERRQDYAQAGLPAPEDDFPVSWSEISALTDDLLPDPTLVVTHEDERGFTAETRYTVSRGSDTPDNWTLTLGERDEDGTQRFIFEVDTPRFAEDFDYEAYAQQMAAPMPPKPPAGQTPDGDGGRGLAGLMESLQAIMSGTAAELDLDAWYLQRIVKEAGTPVFIYRITMPGEITAHTIGGVPAGTLDAGGRQVTLVVDDTYLRTFGTHAGTFRVESQVSECEALCAAQPHTIWDKSASGPGCTCICDVGYETDDRGDCVACDQVCAAYDPLAVYDPGDSQANMCGCACTGDLMAFAWGEEGGACRCIPGAERQGDTCVCKSGYAESTGGDRCIEQTGDEPEENCPSGTNCLQNPDACVCDTDTVCDAVGPYTDPDTYCSPKIAYILISSELTSYERQWLHGKIAAIRTLYRDKGYTTFTAPVADEDALVGYLTAPSTRAIAYFGHATQPSLEDMNAVDVGNKVAVALLKQYRGLGIPQSEAAALSRPRGQSLDLDYAYIHACHSADTMALRDYLVGSGGTYWGHAGILFATQRLTAYTRP
jgi:hypothetical protein